MNIRPYRDQDWSRLCEIHDQARVDELRGAGLTEAFLPLEIAAAREDLFGYQVWVAEQEGQVVGFVAHNEDELAWLYVDPSRYRGGIGRRLVAAVVDAAQGVVSVEVLRGNRAALALYAACGFVESGSFDGHMPGNERYAVTGHVLRAPDKASQTAANDR